MTDSSQRSKIEYSTLNEFRQDAERIAQLDYRTVGKWSFGQIMLHLAMAIEGSIDGFPFRGPWYIRKLAAPLIKNSLLSKPLKPGFRLPKYAENYLPDPDVTTYSALSRVQSAVSRIQVEAPQAEHPFLGKLAEEEWMRLHVRHAELHMSFVVVDE